MAEIRKTDDTRKPPINPQWEIDTVVLGRYLLEGKLEEWFNNELAEALHQLISTNGEGNIDVTFHDCEPIMQFWTEAYYDELTCSKPLAGAIEAMIDSWGSDINDDECGPQLRRSLLRCREVLLAAVDKIDTTLRHYSDDTVDVS
jgi:hypothetical protein